MRSTYILTACVALVFGLLACTKKDNDELAHHHHDHEHEHEHHGHSHGEEGEEEGPDVISLSPEAAKLFGLETEDAVVRNFSAVVKAGASIENSAENNAVVSAPTSGIVSFLSGINLGSNVRAGAAIATVKADRITGGDANRLAKIELDAAKAEFERIEGLYADRLVTLSEYNAAKTAYEKAKASYSPSAANGTAVAPISGVITSFEARTGQFVETGQPIATVASSTRLIIRAQVPVKSYSTVSNARDARIAFPSGGEESILLSSLDGQRLDLNSPSASMGGYVPVTFSVRNDGTLIPGQAVEMFILGPDDRKALAVPASSLSEQQGSFFVYEQLDEDCYRRIPVEVGASDGEYVEIKSGLKGGENIVKKGVTAVKLAQFSGVVPEGHSHSH